MLTHELMPGVVLRLPEEGDADELYDLVDANRDHLARWLPWAAAQTHGDTVDYIRRVRRALGENEGLQTAIAVDGALAGMLRGSARDLSTELGYWLAPAHQGRGIMTAAVRAYLDYGFATLGLHRIVIKAGVRNQPSRAIAQRLGFTEEGIERDGERIGETFHDIVTYAMLASEWPR